MHQIDGDRPRSQFPPERLGETDEGRLAHRVQREAREHRTFGDVAADVDDAATGRHVPHGGLRGDERGPDVDRDGLFELRQAQPLQRSQEERAGVVDQNVQPTEVTGGPLDRGDDRGRIGAVRLHRDRPSSGRLDLVHHVVGPMLIPLERQRHVGALLSQAQRHGSTDPTTTAGNQSDLAVKCVVHAEILADHSAAVWRSSDVAFTPRIGVDQSYDDGTDVDVIRNHLAGLHPQPAMRNIGRLPS
jgi:hypothetical protein